MKPVIRIDKATFPCSFQDAGRYGYRKYGVAVSGFMDAEAALLANRMVGNLMPKVTIEYAMGGVEFEILSDCHIAIAGAGGINAARLYRAGERLKIPITGEAVWGYIAIHGGWEAEEVLKSAAFHSRSKLGTAISESSILSAETPIYPHFRNCFVKEQDLPSLDKTLKIRVSKGIHFPLINSLTKIIEEPVVLSSSIDRSGYRLENKVGSHQQNLKSFPILPGSIQWTQSGQLIITMLDGPTVGGYPVIGVVREEDLTNLAQRTPGSTLEFSWYDLD